MRSFVKTTNGNFPNHNFYYAWKGWTQLGYEVLTFEDADLLGDSLWMSLNRSTPVMAGVKVFEEVVQKLGVKYESPDTYPSCLHPFLLRTIKKTTMGEVKKEFSKNETPIFVKPVKHKEFKGDLISSILNLIPLQAIPDLSEVYVSDPIDFVSEHRIYVFRNEILTGKHYTGKWNISPDVDTISKMIQSFRPYAPVAYALDVGVTKNGETALVEINDATSLGNYGLDAMRYADMITNRWIEIMN